MFLVCGEIGVPGGNHEEETYKLHTERLNNIIKELCTKVVLFSFCRKQHRHRWRPLRRNFNLVLEQHRSGKSTYCYLSFRILLMMIIDTIDTEDCALRMHH